MARTAIILAADDRGLLQLFGIPAVRRLAIIAKRLGCENIHVVGRVEPLLPVLSDLIPPGSFHSVDSPDLLDRAVAEIDFTATEWVLVLQACHVLDKHSLARLVEAAQDAPACLLGTPGGGAMDGPCLVQPSLAGPVLRFFWEPRESPLSNEVELKQIMGQDGLPSTLDGTAAGIEASEARLASALAAHTKADDGFMARHFDRRISQRISRRLAHTTLLPNHITLIGMSMGLIAALLLSLPGYWPHVAGALLFVLCVIVDGVDGEVARLTLKESSFGHYLDIITDNIVHFTIFLGIAYGLYHDTGNTAYLKAMWLLMGGFGICLIAVYQCILRLSPEEMSRSPLALRIMALGGNRDFAYLVAVLAIWDHLGWFLVGAAVGSYVFAVGLWTVSYKEKQKRSAAAH